MPQETTAPAATTALAVWSPKTEADVRAIIMAGNSVPKAMMKVAPKGFVAGLRVERKAELIKDSSKLLGGFTDRGFKITSLGSIKTLKSGVQQVVMRLETPKPTASLTLAEFAAATGTTVEEIAKTFGK